jgi:hypothetical protein
MDKWSKKYWVVALVMALVLIGAQFAVAAGNFYIPGSRDIEGGLGEDGKAFEKVYIGNTINFEGTTSDTNEGRLIAPDVGSDIDWQLPATAGTLATTGGSFSGTFTGTITDTTDANIFVSNAVSMQSVTMSGDATMANTGALTIGNNKIGVAESNFNTVTVTFWVGQTTNTATITALSNIIGHYPFSGVDDMDKELINSITLSGTTLTAKVNGTVAGNNVVHKIIMLEP